MQSLTNAAPPRSFRESLHALTANGPETIERSPGSLPGSTLLKVREGNAQVMVARKNADGTVTTGCVSSWAEADAFSAAPASSEGGTR